MAVYKRALAEDVFGEAVLSKLSLDEGSFDGLVILESEPRTWMSAAGLVTKYRRSAARHGLQLALTTRPLAEVEPSPKPSVIRAALAAVHDDALYRAWLARQIEKSRAAVADTKDALEEVARELGAQAGAVRARKPVPDERVHLVAVNVSTAILPALYGLGPVNRCPNPTIHAAVIGRWEREHGARVRHIGADSLSMALERPPRRPADIAWAAIAKFLYCPEYATPVEAAEHVTGSTWSFWWD